MESFFKYCSINSHDDLENEYSLINLFSNQVTFSRRKNFNDLFDSKVLIEKPESRDEVKRIYKQIKGKKKRAFKELYLGDNADVNFEILSQKIEDMFDRYLFYCVTDNPTNNLMWSHYANSHNGFCIEWDSNYLDAKPVVYKEKLPTLKLIDLIGFNVDIKSLEYMVKQSWVPLKTKLKEWEYEREYRFNLSDKSNHLIVKDLGKFALVKFETKWIKSIVFGYRMPNKTRDHIRNNMPKSTVYKEVVISKNKSGLELKKIIGS